MIRFLWHGRVRLALHALRDRPGPKLLLLHELGGSSPERLPEELSGWPGSVFALDFTGHGHSSVPKGGGYTAEVVMGDADTALSELHAATVLGHGLGAYVALLLAGARPAQVRGAILCDGAGLAGGGAEPVAPRIHPVASHSQTARPPDPYALLELAEDIRPPDYALDFAEHAGARSPLERPVWVCAEARPPWLEAILTAEPVVTGTLPEALRRCAKAS